MQSPAVLLCNPGINSFYSELIRRGEVEEARRYLEVCANPVPPKAHVDSRRSECKRFAPSIQEVAKAVLRAKSGLTVDGVINALGLTEGDKDLVMRQLWRGKGRGWFTQEGGTYGLTPEGREWCKFGDRRKAKKAARLDAEYKIAQKVLNGLIRERSPFTMTEFCRRCGFYDNWLSKNRQWYYKVRSAQESLNPKNKRSALCVSSVSFIPDTLSS